MGQPRPKVGWQGLSVMAVHWIDRLVDASQWSICCSRWLTVASTIGSVGGQGRLASAPLQLSNATQELT